MAKDKTEFLVGILRDLCSVMFLGHFSRMIARAPAGAPLAMSCALLLSLSGCAGGQAIGQSSQVEVTDLQSLPEQPVNSYHKIGPQEFLQINVLGSDLLSGKFLTDGSGAIDYPLVGTLRFDGLSPGEAAQVIANSLRGRYVLDPDVRVIPEELDKINFSIGGQVEKPGSFAFEEGLTLLRAINVAGGPSEYAKLNEVLIFREVAGQDYIGVYDVSAIRKGNYVDPKVYPNDVVMVGDSASKRRLETILGVLPAAINALILVDRLGTPN
jgi:polysaccharide export outer membrane protein